jgi:Protein of unknown function (DUF3311)
VAYPALRDVKAPPLIAAAGKAKSPPRQLRQRGDCVEGTMKYLLLILPAAVSLCVPFYNFTEPRLFGFPFFYWLLLLLIPISSVLTFLVYKREKR